MSAGSDLSRAQWRGAAALGQREVTRVLRLWGQTVLPSVISSVLFIAIFGLALGGRIRKVDGVPYESFIIPGLVLMAVGTAAYSNTSSSLYQARFDGFIDDPVSGPMRARHLLVAYLAGGVVRGLSIGALTLVVARILVSYPMSHPFFVLAAFVLAAIAFAALGVGVGLVAKTWDQQSFVGNLVLQPLVFLGGVFYSASLLAEPWKTMTKIFHMVATARYGVLGTSEVSQWLALGVTAALTALMVAWAGWLVARGTGLRT
jgi:ABC-2 type transport system permease protein